MSVIIKLKLYIKVIYFNYCFDSEKINLIGENSRNESVNWKYTKVNYILVNLIVNVITKTEIWVRNYLSSQLILYVDLSSSKAHDTLAKLSQKMFRESYSGNT